MAEQKTFKYRNQEYVVEITPNKRYASEVCTICGKANKDYLKGNRFQCVALTKLGNMKFDCIEKTGVGTKNYPKRIK